jgi:hypothetical protein
MAAGFAAATRGTNNSGFGGSQLVLMFVRSSQPSFSASSTSLSTVIAFSFAISVAPLRYEFEKIKPSAFSEVLSSFDRVWGFWRPGKGCILPRKWQSPTCLFFGCLPFMKKKDRHDLVQISASAGDPKAISNALAVTLMDAELHSRQLR